MQFKIIFVEFSLFLLEKGMRMFNQRTPAVALDGVVCFELMTAYITLVLCKCLIILWCIYQ